MKSAGDCGADLCSELVDAVKAVSPWDGIIQFPPSKLEMSILDYTLVDGPAFPYNLKYRYLIFLHTLRSVCLNAGEYPYHAA